MGARGRRKGRSTVAKQSHGQTELAQAQSMSDRGRLLVEGESLRQDFALYQHAQARSQKLQEEATQQLRAANPRLAALLDDQAAEQQTQAQRLASLDQQYTPGSPEHTAAKATLEEEHTSRSRDISAKHERQERLRQRAGEEIYEAEESQIFIFNDNFTGNVNSAVNYNIPLSIWEAQKKYIEKLEEENNTLREKLSQHNTKDQHT